MNKQQQIDYYKRRILELKRSIKDNSLLIEKLKYLIEHVEENYEDRTAGQLLIFPKEVKK